VREVLALCVAPNRKVCAVSERRAHKPGDPIVAQISLFHVSSQARMRCLQAPGKAPFTGLSFSGDSKYLVSVNGDPDYQMVVWQWDKETIHTTASLSAVVTRVCCNPSPTFQVRGPPTHTHTHTTRTHTRLRMHTGTALMHTVPSDVHGSLCPPR
jgi:hypothetical protein